MTKDKIYIFGYGSLVSVEDVIDTLARKVEHIYPVTLNGWVRDWEIKLDMSTCIVRYKNAATHEELPYVAVLNVRPPKQDEEPTNPNGVLFEINEDELAAMDERENHYDRIDVTDQIKAPAPVKGRVFTYSSRLEHLSKPGEDLVIPESYKILVETVFDSLGQGMLNRFNKTTKPSARRVVPTIPFTAK